MLFRMPAPQRRRLGALSIAGCLLLIAAPAAAQTFPTEPELPPVTGLAWDADAEELYTVSDRDPTGTVRVLNADGQISDELTFGDEMISTQAVALHPSGLYVGDLGNPGLERDTLFVYRINGDEVDRYEFAYPDGQHDAAAMAISGIGRLWFITRGDDPGVYNASRDLSSGNINQLTRMADAPDGVTDAAFIDDGTTMVLRSVDGVLLYDAVGLRITDETIYEGGRSDESITTFTEGQILVGDSQQLRIEPLPDGFATVAPEPLPEPSPESEPSPETSPSPGADNGAGEPAEDDTEPQVQRSGTIRALIGAGLLAVAAGVLTFAVRGRPTR